MKKQRSKILLYDLETSYTVGAVWGLYEQNIAQVIHEPYILSFAWKWLGEKNTHVVSLPDFKEYKKDKRDDSGLVQKLWELFDEAEVIIAHNGNSFDQKWSYARFVINGLQPPSPALYIDTKVVAKSKCKFNSNSLNNLGQYFKLGKKVETGGIDLWIGCIERNDKKSWKKMCLSPEHKLLGIDLKWKEADKFKVGDTILGFDENGPHRKYKNSLIESIQYDEQPLYEVTFKSGKKFKATIDHQWLTVNWTNGRVGSFKWKTTEELYFDGHNLKGVKPTNMIHINDSIPKLFDVWKEDESKEAGWLAGMFDGEGSLYNGGKRNGGADITISQKEGYELEKIIQLIGKFSDNSPSLYSRGKSKIGNLPMGYVRINGNVSERLKFLGKIRPERLIKKVNFDRTGRLESRNFADEICDIKPIGNGKIIKLKTSTHTFIADGYPMHNCDYNKQDVVLLEKVYLKLRPFITNHPNMNIIAGGMDACPNCRSINVKKRGISGTRVSMYQRYWCRDCGSWSRGETIKRDKRDILIR